jgi:hypothetical protein
MTMGLEFVEAHDGGYSFVHKDLGSNRLGLGLGQSARLRAMFGCFELVEAHWLRLLLHGYYPLLPIIYRLQLKRSVLRGHG